MLRRQSLLSLFVVSVTTFQQRSFAMATATTAPSVTPHDNSYRAIVVGATGATGKYVVQKLLEKKWFVTTISRREYENELLNDDMRTRLTSISSNFTAADTESLIHQWNGHDALFNCLGKSS